MKKVFSSLLIAAMAMTGVSAMAQTDNNTCNGPQNCNVQTECTRRADCGKKGPRTCAFEGLQLTEQQQAALKAIPTPGQSIKALKEQQKQAQKDQQKADRAARCQAVKDIRANYLKSVKEVLTPEQYVQFLENNYVNQLPGDRNGHHNNGKYDRKHFKGNRKDFKGDRKDSKNNSK